MAPKYNYFYATYPKKIPCPPIIIHTAGIIPKTKTKNFFDIDYLYFGKYYIEYIFDDNFN